MSEHGTASAYRWGCRCGACVSALPHGTLTGYTGWKCRCDACKEARASYDLDRRQAHAAGAAS